MLKGMVSFLDICADFAGLDDPQRVQLRQLYSSLWRFPSKTYLVRTGSQDFTDFLERVEALFSRGII